MLKKFNFSGGAATNSLLLAFVRMITMVLGIIVTKLLAVNFSLSEYGTYAQALLIINTVTSLSILGLMNAASYFYNRTEDEIQKITYIATIFLIELVAGILCAFFVVLFRNEISSYLKNSELAGIIPIIALIPLLTNFLNIYQTLFISIGKAKVIAIRNFVVSVLRLIAVFIACYVLNDIFSLLVVILLLDFLQVNYFYFLFKSFKSAIWFTASKVRLIKPILSFSIPMSIYVIVNSLSRDVDKYVISAFSNTETLAVYTNAAKLLPFDLITASLITVLIPIITKMLNQGEYLEAERVFKLYLRIGYFFTFIFIGGAIAVSENLMLFLYDKKYIIGLPIFVVYLVVDMIRFANVTTILSGSGKTGLLMWISIITLIFNAVFNIIGYKLLGIIGPALVTLLFTLAMTIALLYFGAKELRSTIINLFDFKEIFSILLEVFVVGISVYYLSLYFKSISVHYAINLFLCYGFYLAVMFYINSNKIIMVLRELNNYR